VGVNEVVTAYGAAWNETDEAARRKLLDHAWADDGVYCDPTAIVNGRDALVAHIAGFHQQFPGARIDQASGVDAHDGWLRFAWTMLAADGATIMDGFDVGELGPDRRLRRIVGFFGPFPPLDG
jgi:SnoaL-like domain